MIMTDFNTKKDPTVHVKLGTENYTKKKKNTGESQIWKKRRIKSRAYYARMDDYSAGQESGMKNMFDLSSRIKNFCAI